MKKIVIIILLFAVNLILAQALTTGENYVYTKIYLSVDGNKKSESVQYFDGLGRPKQIIQVKATPSGQDLAVPIVYDASGRQTKTLLPVPIATGNSAIHTIDENTVNSYYGVANAYSEQKLESSALGRVMEKAHPGATWAMTSGHTVKMQYLINGEGDQVKKYNTTNAWSNGILKTSISDISFYAPNQLSKSKVTDEDGNVTTDFKNSEGKTVLIRKESSAGKLDTYYIYNNYSQLAFIISPKGNEKINANGNVVTSQILDDLCYQYIYDNRFRQVEKRLPGKGWEYMVYDQQNRIVASQDANMRNSTNNPNRWMFTRHDKFGRVVYTGVFTGGTRAQEQNNANAKGLNNETRSTSSFVLNGQEIFYTNTAYPSVTFVPYSVNYYDTYPGTTSANTVPVPQTILGEQTLSSSVSLTVNNVSSLRSLKSMPTASMVKNLDDDLWSSTHIWYDRSGRSIGSQGKNHLGGYTRIEKQLDFSGAILFANSIHKRSSSDSEVIINERFIYDNNLRVKQHYHKVNNNVEELLADYSYNELGQVTNKKVGNNLQSIDYTYNIRGWVTKVNDPANLGSKLFGYELKFDTTSNSTVAKANYNGNITEAIWKNAEDGVLKKYSYQYDPYNRLTAALYQEPESTVPQGGLYNETMHYDSNGNIIDLKRNQKGYNGFLEEIDDLVYSYNGNRLTSVLDHKNNYSGYPDTSGNTINYDFNGNMMNHFDKGILEIKYNDLNLPSYLKFDNYVERLGENVYKNINYSYRADGVKIKKVHHFFSKNKTADIFATTEYIDGFQYSNEQNFATGVILKFFSTSEGYFDFANNRYIYNYADHLGNVRVSFTKQGSAAVILEKNDYYAFGLKHENVIDQSGVGYNYEYNGKELQMETGMYDYGARFYMPDLGRWGVIDPLAEATTHLSPYHYANNNPVIFNDPTGMLSQSFIDNIMGSSSGTTWTNNGIGFTNNWGGMMDYAGNALNFGSSGSLYRLNQYFDATGATGGGNGTYTPSFTGQLFFELIAVGYTKESVAMKPTNADIDKVAQIDTMKKLIAMLNVAAGEKGKSPTFVNTSMSALGKSEGWRILLNLSKIETVYDLAYVMGHEINHTITDYFKSTFKDIVRSNTQMGSQAYIIYSEYKSYSWEVSLGYEQITKSAWDHVYDKHGPHPALEAKFKEMGKQSPFYGQAAFNLAEKHLHQLNAAYKIFYKKLIK